MTAPLSSSWWSQFVNDEDMAKLEHSGKLLLLMDILRQCEMIGDKVLVFSQSLVSLDLIEEFLVAEGQKMAENRDTLSLEVNVCSFALSLSFFLFLISKSFILFLFSKILGASRQSHRYLDFERGLFPSGRFYVGRTAQKLVQYLQQYQQSPR